MRQLVFVDIEWRQSPLACGLVQLDHSFFGKNLIGRLHLLRIGLCFAEKTHQTGNPLLVFHDETVVNGYFAQLGVS